LRPEFSAAQLMAKLERQRADQSLANLLRKALTLPPVAINLLREGYGKVLAADLAALAGQLKAVPIRLTGTQDIARAISTAGGVAFDEFDSDFMIRVLPGVYAVGEMLDWEAPTGGYLLQATFATAVVAARAIAAKLGV
jgi:predicted flavoprotein YhiN